MLRQSTVPGRRLPSERALGTKLGVSRNTVREGLQQLAARGLIVIRQGSGVFIATKEVRQGLSAWGHTSTPLQRDEMFEVRQMIECSAARLAAERAKAIDRRYLKDKLDRLELAIASNQVDLEAEVDAEFHAALIAAAHNSMLTKIYISLNHAIRSHISTNTFEASNIGGNASIRASSRLQQHRLIYDCVCKKEPAQAYFAASEHLKFVRSQFSGGPNISS